MKVQLLLVLIAFCSAPMLYGQTRSNKPADVYQLGDQQVHVPPPDGFVEVSNTFQKVEARMRAADATNETLGVFVPETFVPRLRQSQDIDLDLYAKLAIMPLARNTTITKAQFDGIVAELEKNFDTYMDPNGPTMKNLQRNSSKDLSNLYGVDTSVGFTGTKNLGFFDKNDNVFSAMALSAIKLNERKLNVLLTFSLVNTGKRLLFVYMYKQSPTGDDVAKLRDLTKKWTSSIIADNQ
jgi:hypothetical protein